MDTNPTEALRELLDALASMHLVETSATIRTEAGTLAGELRRHHDVALRTARASLDKLGHWLVELPSPEDRIAAPTIAKLAHPLGPAHGPQRVVYALDDGPRVTDTIGPLVVALEHLAQTIEATP